MPMRRALLGCAAVVGALAACARGSTRQRQAQWLAGVLPSTVAIGYGGVLDPRAAAGIGRRKCGCQCTPCPAAALCPVTGRYGCQHTGWFWPGMAAHRLDGSLLPRVDGSPDRQRGSVSASCGTVHARLASVGDRCASKPAAQVCVLSVSSGSEAPTGTHRVTTVGPYGSNRTIRRLGPVLIARERAPSDTVTGSSARGPSRAGGCRRGAVGAFQMFRSRLSGDAPRGPPVLGHRRAGMWRRAVWLGASSLSATSR